MRPLVNCLPRGAPNSYDTEIVDAHELTKGHVFWLDLISIHVSQQPSTSIQAILAKIRSGEGYLPDDTLNSIWMALRDREQTVLRGMAETVRPETDNDISDYLSDKLNYHKVIKALNALRAMNLVVVKRRPKARDVLELHPLVRQFIRRRFSQPEQSWFIERIIRAYTNFMGVHRKQLSHSPTFTILQHWTQLAELDVAAGKMDDAFATLRECANAFGAGAYSREFCRAVRLILSSVDWVSEHGKYKNFDYVFHAHFRNVVHLGEFAEAEQNRQNRTLKSMS